MNKTSWAGLVVLILGLVCVFLAQVGIENKQEVFRLGSITATSTTTKTYPALRYVGGGLIVGGVIVFGIGYINRR
jgi:Na+/H+ antiporter NhaA